MRVVTFTEGSAQVELFTDELTMFAKLFAESDGESFDGNVGHSEAVGSVFGLLAEMTGGAEWSGGNDNDEDEPDC